MSEILLMGLFVIQWALIVIVFILIVKATGYLNETNKSLKAWKEADARMCETERKIATMKLDHYEKTGEML